MPTTPETENTMKSLYEESVESLKSIARQTVKAGVNTAIPFAAVVVLLANDRPQTASVLTGIGMAIGIGTVVQDELEHTKKE